MSNVSGGGEGAGMQTLAGKRLRSVKGNAIDLLGSCLLWGTKGHSQSTPTILGLTGQHLWRKKVLATKWKESAFEEQLQF